MCRTTIDRIVVVVMGLLTIGLVPRPATGHEPGEVIRLFNGKDLDGLSTWLRDSGREDPKRVFRVQDGQIHISGEGYGYLATEQPHGDYRLVVEYRWGDRTDGGKSVRNSGILLHAAGPDGNAQGTWMASVECQLAQGCVGDLIVIPGREANGQPLPVKITSDVAIGPDDHPRWKEGGAPRVFTQGQLWWSDHDPEFRELLDTRGRNDVEKPRGEWNRVECVCEGDRIEIRVNGVTVNRARAVEPSAGKILLQTEGFELFVRKFELHPLTK